MKQVILIVLSFCILTSVEAGERGAVIHNTVQNVQGNPFAKTRDGKIIQIRNGQTLRPGLMIYTHMSSSFEILFEDQSILEIYPMTAIKIDKILANRLPGKSEARYKSSFKLKLGKVRASVSRKKGVLKSFAVHTPTGTASVRGTEKIVSYAPDRGMDVKTLHGRVLVLSQSGLGKYINKGEATQTQKNLNTKLLQKESSHNTHKALLSTNEKNSGTAFKDTTEDANFVSTKTQARKTIKKVAKISANKRIDLREALLQSHSMHKTVNQRTKDFLSAGPARNKGRITGLMNMLFDVFDNKVDWRHVPRFVLDMQNAFSTTPGDHTTSPYSLEEINDIVKSIHTQKQKEKHIIRESSNRDNIKKVSLNKITASL